MQLSFLSNQTHATTPLQWPIIILVGGFLGAYAIAFSMLDTDWALLSLVAIVGAVGVVILGEVKKPLIIAMLFDIPIPIDQFFRLRTDGGHGGIEGYVVSITTICLVALYALWLAELFAKRTQPRSSRSDGYMFWAVLPLIALIGAGALSAAVAKDTEMVYFELFLLVQMLLVFVYVVGNIHTFDDLIFIFQWVVIAAAVHSLIMIGITFYGSTFELGNMIKIRLDKGYRVGGTIGGPNSAAGYLELIIVPTLSLVLLPVSRSLKFIGFASFALMTVAILLTQSRGGWAAFALSMALFFVVACYRGWIPISTLFILGFVALAVGIGFYGTLVTRITGDDNGAFAGRLPLITVAFNMISDNPILGIGMNNFSVELLNYARLDKAFLWRHVVHNKFLLVWAETGTIGFVAFCLFLLNSLIRGWKTWTLQNKYFSPLALGFVAAILGHMLHMNVDIFQGRSLVQMLWLTSGLVVVLHRLAKENKSEFQSEALVV